MPASSVVAGAPQTGSNILARSRDGTAVVWVWQCTTGSFEWNYNEDETIYLISGEVFISCQGGPEKRFAAGDMGFFPGGTVATWRVTQPVKKVAITRKDLPRALGFLVRVCHKLAQFTGLRGRSSL